MTRARKRSDSVSIDDGVTAVLQAPFLVFYEGEHVGAGATVVLHPATARGWIRNGWVVPVDDADDDDTAKATLRTRRSATATTDVDTSVDE